MTSERGSVMDEATPRPWMPQSPDDGASEPWYIDTHAYPEGPEPVWAPSYPVSEADVTLICEAVNAYDRLRRIERAAVRWLTAYDMDDGAGFTESDALRDAVDSKP